MVLENTLKYLLEIYGKNKKLIIRMIQSTVNMNSSTNKRKYNILTIISEYLEPDWLIKNYKVFSSKIS